MSNKFTLTCEDQGQYPFVAPKQSKKTSEFSATYVDDIIQEVENFLKGCGYNIDGKLKIVKENPATVTISNFGSLGTSSPEISGFNTNFNQYDTTTLPKEFGKSYAVTQGLNIGTRTGKII
jgi:hypothetical protein